MKTIKTLLIAIAMVAFVACGSKSYSPETCQKLVEKINSHENLTEADNSAIIDQLEAITSFLSEKKAEIGDDKEKAKEFQNSKEAVEGYGYVLQLGFYLDAHKTDLTESQIKQMNKIAEQFNEIKD